MCTAAIYDKEKKNNSRPNIWSISYGGGGGGGGGSSSSNLTVQSPSWKANSSSAR